jgi:hypothetical protein
MVGPAPGCLPGAEIRAPTAANLPWNGRAGLPAHMDAQSGYRLFLSVVKRRLHYRTIPPVRSVLPVWATAMQAT